ncbi:MAG: nuclear transport factor 2 family protein [Acidobacteria bacterium]|nr:nuclear transport factor 2 family protein [Acidobacteriota bacterium]
MNDVNAIRLAKTELREGYNTGNVRRILSVFSDGLGDLSTGCASFWGPEAKAVLGHRLKRMFARSRVTLAVTIISIRIAGDWAFDWGWHSLTVTPRKGGRPRNVRTRYLEIWVKENDGKWRIAIFLDNIDLPPQMPPREVLQKMRPKRRQSRPVASAQKR